MDANEAILAAEKEEKKSDKNRPRISFSLTEHGCNSGSLPKIEKHENHKNEKGVEMENQNRTRNNQVLVRFTDDELKNVRRRMILAKTMNREAFIRKMALDGFILNTDTTYQEKQYYEMHKIGVNVNQIAKLANTNGSVSQKDIEELKGTIKEIWHILRSSPSNPQ